jgi:hypothetical protein
VALPADIKTRDIRGEIITLTASSDSNKTKIGSATVLVQDLIAYDFYVSLVPQNKDLSFEETLLVDVVLNGSINYTQVFADIVYDTSLLQFDGYTYLQGVVAAVTPVAPNKVTVRSVSSMNMITGMPCANGEKIATLKFKFKDGFAGNNANAVLSIASALITPAAAVTGPITACGESETINFDRNRLTKEEASFLSLLDYSHLDNLGLYLSKEIGNRPTLSPRRDMAVEWIMDELTSYGYAPYVQQFTASGNPTVDGIFWIDGKHYVYYGPAWAASTVYSYNNANQVTITGATSVNWANSANAFVLPEDDYTGKAVFVVCNGAFPNAANAYNAALALQNAGAAAVMFQTLPMAANGNTTYARLANTTTGTNLTIPVGSVLHYETNGILASLTDTTTVQLSLRAAQEVKNVIATLPAAKPTNKTIYITSHHDTTGSGPGMTDNGSGVIMMLEMARAWKNVNFNCNLQFVFFDSEESGGMRGSSTFCQGLTAQQRADFVANYNMDMIATSQADCEWMFMNISDTRLQTMQNQIPAGTNNALADNPAAVAVAKEYGIYNTTMKAAARMNFTDKVLFCYDTTTDHVQFVRNGMPNAVEYDWRSNRRGTGFELLYHRAGDTYELNFSLARCQTQGDIISLAIFFADQDSVKK